MNKKHRFAVIVAAIIAVIVVIILSITIYIQLGQIRLPASLPVSPPPVAKHTFKATEIYPTKPGCKWSIELNTMHK
jgi:preprotein translocase subunit SecY